MLFMLSYIKCISKWIHGYAVTTRNNQRLQSVGGNDAKGKMQCFVCKFHVTVGQNCTCDQNTSDRRSKCA